MIHTSLKDKAKEAQLRKDIGTELLDNLALCISFLHSPGQKQRNTKPHISVTQSLKFHCITYRVSFVQH